MAKKKFDVLINEFMNLIGGESNIENLTFCMTRLRVNVKDKGLVQEEEISKLPDIAGYQWSGDQLQIIVGTTVENIYNAIVNKYHLTTGNGEVPEDVEKKKFSFSLLLETLASCMTPMIPVLIGGGMIKVILLVATMTGILTDQSATYITLNFVSDSAFYFLPVFVGAASARVFGLNMYMGLFFGAVLINPTFVTMIAEGNAGSIFGLPIYEATYSTSIFPVILTVWLASYVERLARRVSPDFLSTMLVPLITILVTVPVMLVVTGPVGAIVGSYLTTAIIWVYDTAGFVGMAVLGALLPWLIITGMHHSFTPYVFQTLASLGYEPFFLVITVINNVNQGIASLAVAAKSKETNIKTTASTTGLTAVLAGVTEPALFGVTLKYRTPLYGVMIGNAIGGAVAGILKVVIYTFAGSWGVFALPAFMGNPSSNVIYMIIAMVVGMIATFVSTYIMYKDPV